MLTSSLNQMSCCYNAGTHNCAFQAEQQNTIHQHQFKHNMNVLPSWILCHWMRRHLASTYDFKENIKLSSNVVPFKLCHKWNLCKVMCYKTCNRPHQEQRPSCHQLMSHSLVWILFSSVSSSAPPALPCSPAPPQLLDGQEVQWSAPGTLIHPSAASYLTLSDTWEWWVSQPRQSPDSPLHLNPTHSLSAHHMSTMLTQLNIKDPSTHIHTHTHTHTTVYHRLQCIASPPTHPLTSLTPYYRWNSLIQSITLSLHLYGMPSCVYDMDPVSWCVHRLWMLISPPLDTPPVEQHHHNSSCSGFPFIWIRTCFCYGSGFQSTSTKRWFAWDSVWSHHTLFWNRSCDR